jgi:hypothetical protein
VAKEDRRVVENIPVFTKQKAYLFGKQIHRITYDRN